MSRIQKLAILSISMLLIMSSAPISPVLPDIADYFSDVSDLTIRMVVSLPGLFIIPVAIWTGRLIHHYHKKHILIVGLTLFLIGGLGGAFASHIIVLLVFRAIMGIGVGFIIPLTRSLVADFFHGKERNKMMGYSVSFNNLGGIVATILAGVLTIFGWRFPFLVYLLALPVLLMVVRYLPEQEITPRDADQLHINKNVLLLGLSHFILIQVFFAVPTDLGFFIETNGYGGGIVTAILISLVTLGSFIVGFIFHWIKEHLHGFTVSTGMILLALGMLGIGVSWNVWIIALALLLVGFGLGIVAANIYLQTSIDSSPSDITMSLAIVSAASFLGQFTAPIIMVGIKLITGYDTISSPFIISFWMGIISVIAIFINKRIKIYHPKEI